MKIKKFTRFNYKKAVDFYHTNISLHYQKLSYPVFDNKHDIQSEFYKCAVKDKKAQLLGCYKDHRLIGVMSYFCYNDEKQLQTTCLFTLDNDKIVIKGFIDYLNEKYKDYTICIGIESTYIQAIDTLKSLSFKLVDNAITYVQNVSGSNTESYKKYPDVKRITQDTLDNYLEFHKQNYDSNGYYWTSYRVMESFDSFNIYAIYDNNNTIKSAMFIQHYPKEGLYEVFGMTAVCNDDATKLMEHSFADIKLSDPNFKKYLYMIDIDEDYQQKAAIALGFDKKSHYNCFMSK